MWLFLGLKVDLSCQLRSYNWHVAGVVDLVTWWKRPEIWIDCLIFNQILCIDRQGAEF